MAIGIGCAPVFSNQRPWTPKSFAKTAIWLRGDLGRTIVLPTIKDPTDLSTANWTHTFGTTPNATEIDWVSGTSFYVSGAGNPINYSSGVSTTITAEMWLGTGATQGFLQWGGTVGRYTVDLSTGTSVSTGTTITAHSITSLGGGHYLVSMTSDGTGGTGLYVGGIASSAASIHATNITFSQAGSVSAWANQGNNKTLLSSVSQATFAKMPLVSTMNSLPALSYSSAALMILSGNLGSTLSQPFTSFAAIKPATSATNRRILDSTGATSYINVDSAGTYTGNFGSVLTSAVVFTDGTRYIASILANGASSNMYVNGSSVISGNLGTNGYATALAVGGSNASFNGVIGEVIVYAGNAVADGAFTPITNYLQRRYGI